jgi:hypothetical protein
MVGRDYRILRNEKRRSLEHALQAVVEDSAIIEVKMGESGISDTVTRNGQGILWGKNFVEREGDYRITLI